MQSISESIIEREERDFDASARTGALLLAIVKNERGETSKEKSYAS